MDSCVAVRKFLTLATRLGVIAAVLLLMADPASCFITSEDQQFQADIAEAKARAKDFQKTMDRIDRDQRLLESYGPEKSRQRVKDAEEEEQARRDFVRIRNNRPSELLERDRLERDDEWQKKQFEAQMDVYRRDYVRKRDRVRTVLERDAYIDSAREYGL